MIRHVLDVQVEPRAIKEFRKQHILPAACDPWCGIIGGRLRRQGVNWLDLIVRFFIGA